MYYCVYCGKSFDQNLNFCPYCGKAQPKLAEAVHHDPIPAPAEAAVSPEIPAGAHTAYSFDGTPAMKQSARIFGKLSFYLGIASLVVSALTITVLAILMATGTSISVNLELLSAPLGVAAIIFGILARKQGNYLKQPTLGRIFGIIGLVLSVVSIILLFLYARQVFNDIIGVPPDFSL